MAHSKSYSYPTLKPGEIILCMAELQIPFTDEDLNKPSIQRMLGVYDAFMDIFLGVTRDHFATPNFAMVEILEYPDLHQEGLGLMAFYRQLYQLVVQAGVEDFSLRDVLKPEPPRVRRILSAVINFAKFREERMAVFEQCTAKSDEISERRQILDQRNGQLAENVNTLRLQRAAEEPATEQAKLVNAGIKTELREMKKHESGLASELDALKKGKEELQEKMNNLNLLIETTKADCARIRARIVHNPEQLKQALSEMGYSLGQEKTNIAALEKKAREIQGKIDMLTVVEEDITMCVKAMQECGGEIEKYQHSVKKVQREKENIDRRQTELKESNLKDGQLRRQLGSQNEKLMRLQRHQTLKRETHEDKLIKLRDEYGTIAAERSNQQVKIEDCYSTIELNERKMQELIASTDSEMQHVQNEYNKLRGQIDVYQDEVLRTMISLNEREV